MIGNLDTSINLTNLANGRLNVNKNVDCKYLIVLLNTKLKAYLGCSISSSESWHHTLYYSYKVSPSPSFHWAVANSIATFSFRLNGHSYSDFLKSFWKNPHNQFWAKFSKSFLVYISIKIQHRINLFPPSEMFLWKHKKKKKTC